MGRAKSRDATRAQTAAVLTALLRSPKTRDGLAAAAASKGFTRNFVFGWLAVAEKQGRVVRREACQLKPEDLYVDSRRDYLLWPRQASDYPAWMDPFIHLPQSWRRTIYRDGAAYHQKQKQQVKPCKTRTASRGSSST